MSLYELFTSKGVNGLGYGTTAEQATEGVSLAGKTMLVTGCNSGLGLEAMRVLAWCASRRYGAHDGEGEGGLLERDGLHHSDGV